MNRVAVTGLGLLCGLGNNVAECWPKLCSGVSGITPLADRGAPPYKFQYGAQAHGFNPGDHFSEKESMLLERFALMAVVAAREAIAQSGLGFVGTLAERTAIVTGTSVGGQFAEEIGYYRLYKENNPRVAPLTIPRTMSNAGASAISVEYGITGPVYTVSTACASSNHAIGQAFWMIRNGQVLAAIAGGSEAVFAEGLLRAWEAMRVVSSQPCRPFSADRSGLTLGEGAAILVLENWDHAEARGAGIFAEITGFGMSSDAHHITQPCVNGPANAMRWALSDAGLASDRVDYINAHGTGTLANDITETQAIRTVFGEHVDQLLVSSTKSMHGHALGAAGAIEAVATVLALKHGLAPPTVNYSKPDPACNLNLVTGHARSAPLEIAISNTFAFGGLNASLVIQR
jgi:nodulation protein E